MAATGGPNGAEKPSDDQSPTVDVLPDFEHGHGHYFTKKTFHKPTYCHHCTDMLWGLIGQGFVCEDRTIYLHFHACAYQG